LFQEKFHFYFYFYFYFFFPLEITFAIISDQKQLDQILLSDLRSITNREKEQEEEEKRGKKVDEDAWESPIQTHINISNQQKRKKTTTKEDSSSTSH